MTYNVPSPSKNPINQLGEIGPSGNKDSSTLSLLEFISELSCTILLNEFFDKI